MAKPSYDVYIEEKSYDKASLKNLLGERQVLKLLDNGIIKAGSNDYKFTFVGVITCYDSIFVVFPKMTGIDQVDDNAIVILVKCLKQYSQNTEMLYEGIDYFTEEPDNNLSSELAIADFIIKDYRNNGIYQSNKFSVLLDGNGPVNWSHTINYIDPVFSNGSPIYCNTYNEVTEIETDHIISEIHKWCITYCYRYLPFFAEKLISPAFSCRKRLVDIGEAEELIAHLNSKLISTFGDREIRLLKSLKYLILSKLDADAKEFSLYGTKNFEYAWETICVNLFQSNKGEILRKYKSSLSNTVWNLIDIPAKTRSIDLRLDILIDDQDKKVLYILDAKYYHFIIGEISFSGEPESSSVLKQFFYQKYYSTLDQYCDFYNAFLIPINDTIFDRLQSNPAITKGSDTFLVCGSITFNPHYPGQKVIIVVLPILKAMSQFVKNEKIDVGTIFSP